MTNILEYRHIITDAELTINGTALLDGRMTMATPFQLPAGGQPKVQICAISISDRIPNVFNAYPYYNFNNTIVRVSTDQPGEQVDIQLPTGLYLSVDEISTAINAALEANTIWIHTPGYQSIKFSSNIVTDKVIVTIDSTHLNAPRTTLTMDIRKTSTDTDLATTLGFSQSTANMLGVPLAAKDYVSNQIVQMDTQGTTADIQCSIMPWRRRNGVSVPTMALVTYAGKTTTSDNIWPSAGQISPVTSYGGGKQITHIEFYVKTLNGDPMLFMNGGIHVVLAFTY